MKNSFYRLLVDGDPVKGMQPSDFTDPDTFTTGDKSETNHTFFQTDDGYILTGVWESAPCREEIESYPAHEMMTVLSGSVTLTDARTRSRRGTRFSLPKAQNAPGTLPKR